MKTTNEQYKCLINLAYHGDGLTSDEITALLAILEDHKNLIRDKEKQYYIKDSKEPLF